MKSYVPSASGESLDRASLYADPALPLENPGRPVLGYNFPKALHHFRELLKDKEQTEEVFHIFEALPWKQIFPVSRQFAGSAAGQALRAKEPYLPAILDDHAALRRTPKGSLGHAYCDFMEREGLSAQGLVDEYGKFIGDRPMLHDQMEWYGHRLRDTHDLLHVLTGYGRDALGEQCVLAFTYSQQPSPAHLFIGYAGGLHLMRTVPVRAPIFRAIREGQRLGKACPRLVEQPVTELLALPIDHVRQRLNITPALWYHEVHRIWRAAGLDPYDLWNEQAAQPLAA